MDAEFQRLGAWYPWSRRVVRDDAKLLKGNRKAESPTGSTL